MEPNSQKVSRVAFAYLWSILFWMGLAVLAAAEDKVRFLERAPHILLDRTPYRRRISTVRGAVDASHFRDSSPLSDHQTDSDWSRSWVCSWHRRLHHRLRGPPLGYSGALEYSRSEV